MPLEYRLEIDDKGTPKLVKFRDETKKTSKMSEKLGKAIKGVGAGMAVMGAAAVAGGAAMFKIASDTAQSRDEITKMSRELGVSTEHLSGMNHALQLGGTDLKTYEKGLARLSKNIVDADQGLSTAKQGFTDLGLSIKNSNGVMKTSEELVFEVADKFKDMPDGVLKSAKAQEIFGKSGKNLINTLNQGAEGMRGQMEEAEKLGLVFDQVAGEEAEKFNDTLLRLKQTGAGTFAEMGEELIPLVTETMESLTDTMVTLKPVVSDLFAKMLSGVQFILPHVEDLALGFSGLLEDMSEFTKVDFSEFEDFEKKNEKFINSMKKVGETSKENERQAERAAKAEARRLEAAELAKNRQRAKNKANREKEAKAAAKHQAKMLKAKMDAELDAEIALDNSIVELDNAMIELEKENAEARKELEREISLALMTETERRAFLFEEEQQRRIDLIGNTKEVQLLAAKEVADVEKAAAEEKRRIMEEDAAQVLAVSGELSSTLGNLTDIETARIENRFNERAELLDEQRASELEKAGSDEVKKEAIRKKFDDKERQLEAKKDKDLIAAKKKFAGVQKKIAQGEAVIQGALAFTKALAEGGPFLGPLLAGAIALQTATQVAKIEAQEFFAGGNTGDQQKLISVGENGNEFVVSGSGTRAAGDGALQDLNSGRIEDAANKLLARSGSKTGGIVINIAGGVMDQNFVEDTLVPALNEYQRRV